MPSPTSPPRPTLAALAEVLHAAAPRPGPDGPVPAELVSLRLDAPGEEHPDGLVELGRWLVPGLLSHPIAPLVGFRAPASWDAVGLVSAGWLRHLDRPEEGRQGIASVVLWDREDTCASAFGDPDDAPTVVEDPPDGLAADVLRRVLGLPTPPPELSPLATIDVTWLERLAEGLTRRPGKPRSWAWAADRHPYRGYGPTPSPAALAARARGSELGSWAELRGRLGAAELPAARWGPPGGEVLGLGDWFDDGSLARWLVAGQAQPGALATHVLGTLPPPVAERVVAALVELGPDLEALA